MDLRVESISFFPPLLLLLFLPAILPAYCFVFYGSHTTRFTLHVSERTNEKTEWPRVLSPCSRPTRLKRSYDIFVFFSLNPQTQSTSSFSLCKPPIANCSPTSYEKRLSTSRTSRVPFRIFAAWRLSRHSTSLLFCSFSQFFFSSPSLRSSSPRIEDRARFSFLTTPKLYSLSHPTGSKPPCGPRFAKGKLPKIAFFFPTCFPPVAL